MAKISFGSEFKTKSVYDFPKLSLEKNERARICVVDQAPEMEYVHTLRKIVTENGKPIITTEDFFGKQKEVPKTDFVGQRICLGDPDVLAKSGTDPSCPACKASLENSAVDAPKRRYAVQVIRYKNKPGTFNVSKPFGVELLAWVISDSRFNQLIDIREEHGNLSKMDLTLGPCTNKTFQKFDIGTGATCEWQVDEDRKRLTIETIKENQSDDLIPLLGRKVTQVEMQAEVFGIVEAWNAAFGTAGEMPEEESNTPDEGFSNDLASLLGEDTTDEAPAVEEKDEETSETSEVAEEEPAAEEEKPEPKKDEKKSDDGGVEDLSSLLAGL